MSLTQTILPPYSDSTDPYLLLPSCCLLHTFSDEFNPTLFFSSEFHEGFFFSPYDRDCLPCSPCHQPGDRESGIVAVACKAAGMPRDMQCWPTHAHGNQAPDSQPDLQSTGGDHDTTDLESEFLFV